MDFKKIMQSKIILKRKQVKEIMGKGGVKKMSKPKKNRERDYLTKLLNKYRRNRGE